MKTAIRSFFFIAIGLYAVLISLVYVEKDIKTQELRLLTEQALSETQRVLLDGRYPITSNDEYLAEFTQNFVRNTTSLDNVDIKVYGIDYEKGLLSVGVSTQIKNFNGTSTEASVKRTSIIDTTDRNN
jgi:hypothetical protein